MTLIMHDINPSNLKTIVKVIDDGGVICFPTETSYVLVCDPANDLAIEKLFQIINSRQKPLSLLVGDIYQAKRVVCFNEKANKLALNFFPGPLTIILKLNEHHNISQLINADLKTIGIRMPSHLLSLKIIKSIGRPVISTRAFSSDLDSNVTDQDSIIALLKDKVDLLLLQNSITKSTYSTIVDLSNDEINILREGQITKEEIFNYLSNVIPDQICTS